MSKVAVVYWSGTGNTQMMAEQVAAAGLWYIIRFSTVVRFKKSL